MRARIGVDHEIAAVAGRQGGVIAYVQLRALGQSDGAIAQRVRAGRLHRVHHGVYAVGHPAVALLGRRWGAVLASGADATLSDAAAGAAWAFRRSEAARIDVTVPATGRTAAAGVRLHRRLLADDERTELDGLPITTPARTLRDLAAGGLRGKRLAVAVDVAHQSGVLDFGDLARMVERYRGRPGIPALEDVLRSYDPGRTRSELELLLAELCARHRLPRPQENVVVLDRVRDFAWPRARLVVEADSYAWHRSPAALDDDRERDTELLLAGWRTLRFTWSQVTRRRRWVATAIRHALASDPYRS